MTQRMYTLGSLLLVGTAAAILAGIAAGCSNSDKSVYTADYQIKKLFGAGKDPVGDTVQDQIGLDPQVQQPGKRPRKPGLPRRWLQKPDFETEEATGCVVWGTCSRHQRPVVVTAR